MSQPAQGEISLGIFLESFKAQRTTDRDHFAFNLKVAIAFTLQNGFPANNAMLLPLRLAAIGVIHIRTNQVTKAEAGRDPTSDWLLTCESTRATSIGSTVSIVLRFTFDSSAPL
jgi:hypothetical protein